MNEAAVQGWTTRALGRQIGTPYYERLLSSSDPKAVEAEANRNITALQTSHDFVRDPVMLEFLGLPGVGKLLEADLERGLLDNLQAFLLELAGLCVHSQTISNKLGIQGLFHGPVFYNCLLKCFVFFDLKSGELIHQDIGQMDM